MIIRTLSLLGLGCALLTCPVCVVAQTTTPPSSVPTTDGPLTLAEALRMALENNPEMGAASGRVEAALGRAQQSKAWANPELELSAEEWPLRGGRGYRDATKTIGLSQTLPFPGKKALDKKIGSAGVKHSEAERLLKRMELVQAVKGEFFRVIAQERMTEVLSQTETAAEQSALLVRKRVEAGATAYPEQLRAELQAEQSRTQRADAERELAAARQDLATLLGRPELSVVKLKGDLAEQSDATLLAGATVQALSKHPSIIAAEARVAAAELGRRRARLEAYPDVNVGIAGGQIGETGQSIGQIRVSIPLPVLDRGKGLRQEARANLSVARAELQALQQHLERALATAVNRYRAASAQVGRYREHMLPKALEALRLTQVGFEQGKLPYIDLVDTQRTTAELQIRYLQELLEMKLAQVDLESFTPAPEAADTLEAK